jgi:hypothetical protein
MGQTDDAIDTTGETVSEETTPADSLGDLPPYTVARAVEWMRRPENGPRIERAAELGGEAIKGIATGIDREVTQVGRLFKELATDDDALEDFKDSFLKSVFGL